MNQKLIIVILTWLMWDTVALAAHWTCNPHEWQYDMTAYVRVNDGLRLLSDYGDCELAAFVGNECRGVAQVVPIGNYPYCQVRVRSNAESGDTITWRAYRPSVGAEVEVYSQEPLVFQSMITVGTPSAPLVVRLVRSLVCDVNDNGIVDIDDLNIIINIMIRKDYATRYDGRADGNHDGVVDIDDLNLCINIMVRKA